MSSSIDVEYLTDQKEWSEQTFGPGHRTKGLIDHIKKELVEVAHEPRDPLEWIDVIILAFDGAWRAGIMPQEIINHIKWKHSINKQRKWPDWRSVTDEVAIEHVR